MAEPLQLELLSEKTLHQTADPQLLAYCPSMDLVAITSTDQQVLIYRLNGQRVYGAAQKGSSLKVESVRWKPNGQLLAIAWSDGSVRLVGAESTKVVHQFSTGDISGVTCMGWASNLTSKKRSKIGSKMAPETLEDVLIKDGIFPENQTPVDLPRDLSLIDIETSLPKLSVLAAGGSSEDVFCSRTSLDALFRPFDPRDNDAVDVMVVGTKEGQIHLTIYDSFVVGSFDSPLIIGGAPSHLIRHASHERYSTHALLMQPAGSREGLYFIPMDMRFISASSEYLSLLASRSTALQNLLRYINQVESLMTSEWKATQELPGKFLRNINETLTEKGNRDIVQALYHSMATGHTFPEVREWLVDELAERGHKRWDKAVVSGLEALRRLVHENMLPALDRCAVILSRFAGIAKFQGSNETAGFSNQQIQQIMDVVASLHLVSSKILIQVVDELDSFIAFSAWLRYEIDRLASDSSISMTDEAVEKEASIDHSKVLSYLQTAMVNSPLSVFFGADADADREGQCQIQSGSSIFDQVNRQLQKHEQGVPYIEALPRVTFLCRLLSLQANAVFSQIAETEKQNVLFGKAHELGVPEGSSPMDMAMCPAGDSICHVYIALVPKSGPHQNLGTRLGLTTVQIIQTTLSIESGISNVLAINSSTVQLGDGRIIDVKFSDNLLLVLWESKGNTKLLSIPYRASSGSTDIDDFRLEYITHDHRSRSISTTVFTHDEVLAMFSKYAIPSDESFVPATIEIRDSTSTKRQTNEDNRRVVILEETRLQYKVFKYPGTSRGSGVGEDISMS